MISSISLKRELILHWTQIKPNSVDEKARVTREVEEDICDSQAGLGLISV